jgi:phosphomannomutase/phosphoglucomutase
LKEGDVCVTPVNSAALIELICEQIGARVEYCKIGQPDTGRAIKEFNAAFAFETAAKYGFPGLDWPWFCGIFAGAKMLEIMTVTSKTFSELAAEIPPWFRFDINIPFGDVTAEQRLHIIEASQGMADNAFVRGQGATHNTMDGCKFTLPDHFWAMLRPSGTEPLMRVYATGPDHDRTLALAQEAERYVQEAMKQTLGA